MARLIAVVGLPGSGKSHYVNAQAKKHGYKVASDITQNDWRAWPWVRDQLSQGNDCIIDSATFTDLSARSTLEGMVESVSAKVEWRFFEANKDACLTNIIRDMLLKKDRDYHGRMRSFLRRAPLYKVPEGAKKILPVYSPCDYVDLPNGSFTVKWRF